MDWETHLSYDDSRERVLAEAAHFATALARDHKAQIEQSFPRMTTSAAGIAFPPGNLNPVTGVLWSAYLGHLLGYLSCAVGPEAATGILKQAAAQIGEGITP